MPTLGPRLRECTQTVLDIEGKSLAQIFGSPDDMKFRSSMTLFAHAGADEPLFQKALDKYCGSQYDPLTLERIQRRSGFPQLDEQRRRQR